MNAIEGHGTIRIHIDREPYHSPNPTTRSALYRLAEIPPHAELFREVDGNAEDEAVPRDDTLIALAPDQHFYSERTVEIAVNAELKEVPRGRLSFDAVVRLAFPTPPPGSNVKYTVLYRRGPEANPKGDLIEGQSVRVKEGMRFDVTATDRS